MFYPDLGHPLLAAAFATFHQRFSTNTAPQWRLAQPFRLLAHNGEINTIEGNRHWAEARSAKWRTPAIDLRELKPLVSLHGSDSMSLDNMLEVLLAGGMDLLQAMRVLIPPATGALEARDPDLAAFYDYHALSIDPWDGPAGIVLCDGRYAGCTVDRNGLRPARWLTTRDRHLVIGSETGIYDIDAVDITAKGKIGPGEMIAVDLYSGEFLDSAAIDAINRARAPFKRWLKQGSRYLISDLIDPALATEPFDNATLQRHQKQFQLTREEREDQLRVLAETEQEPIGSMGDDTPLAVLSRQTRSLYDYFRQGFAQVTNPPIDPLREQCVMSLSTPIGREGNVFEMAPENARQTMLNSPILSQRKLRQMLAHEEFANAHERFSLHHEAAIGLEQAIRDLCAEVEASVRAGTVIVILSDMYPQAERLTMHVLLATGAVHDHLVRVGLRCECNLIIETGTARELVTLRRRKGTQTIFDALRKIETYRVNAVRKQSALRRLMGLGRALTHDRINEAAQAQVTTQIVTWMAQHVQRLRDSGQYEGLANQLTSIDLTTIAVTGAVVAEDRPVYTIAAASADIDRRFEQAGLRLSNGLHKEYWKAKAQPDAAQGQNLDSIKVEVIVLAQDHDSMEALQEHARSEFDRLYQQHKGQMVDLTEDRRRHYERLQLSGTGLETISWPLPDTIAFRRTPQAHPFEKHLYVEDDGTFRANLGTWEKGVLEEELADLNVVAWLRNQDRKPWSFEIPYPFAGTHKSMFPDLIIVRKDGNTLRFDILEPHDPTRDDNAHKAVGLAQFAQKHWAQFMRIQLIRKKRGPDGQDHFYGLDLGDETIRAQVLPIKSNDELNRIFDKHAQPRALLT